MSSRLPKSLPPRKSVPPTSSIRSSPIYLQRRSVTYAVGVAAIVIAGALIGAVLKTDEQAEQKKVWLPLKITYISTSPDS